MRITKEMASSVQSFALYADHSSEGCAEGARFIRIGKISCILAQQREECRMEPTEALTSPFHDSRLAQLLSPGEYYPSTPYLECLLFNFWAHAMQIRPFKALNRQTPRVHSSTNCAPIGTPITDSFSRITTEIRIFK